MSCSGAGVTFYKDREMLNAGVGTRRGQQPVSAIDRDVFVVRHSRTRLGKESKRLVIASPSCVMRGKIVRHVCPRGVEAPRAHVAALGSGNLPELLVCLTEVVMTLGVVRAFLKRASEPSDCFAQILVLCMRDAQCVEVQMITPIELHRARR